MWLTINFLQKLLERLIIKKWFFKNLIKVAHAKK